MSVEWTEKYRPEKFDDGYVGNEEAVKAIKMSIDNHLEKDMIFYGPYGTGKTTAAFIYARMITLYPEGCVYLNASDLNKKADVHQYVIDTAKTRTQGPFKVIILDEAEELTTKAQDSLKSFLERKSSKVKVIFIVNKFNKIIPAIKSRCAKVYFSKIKSADIMKRIIYIAAKECKSITQEELGKIAELSKGDLRNAINLLQFGVLKQEDLLDVTDIIKLVKSGKTKSAYLRLSELMESHSPDSVVMSLFDFAMKEDGVPETIFLFIADYEKAIDKFSIYTSTMEFVVKTKKLYKV